MLQSTTIQFLKALKKHNNKTWFDAHRDDYEAARKDFAGLIEQVIDQHGKKDAGIRNLVAKDCLFRINRDIRFSKDKTPYKTNFGASINTAGKKGINSAGYYFHLEPGQSFVGGGIWMPDAAALQQVRQEIDYNLADFKKIIQAKKFRDVYGALSEDREYVLTRVPKGYEADNPAASYLKFKSYVATAPVTDATLGSPGLVKTITQAFEALQPLVAFVNASLAS